MLAQAIKTTAKIAILVAVLAAIVSIFAVIQFPSGNWNQIVNGIGTAKAIIAFYVPAINALLPVMMVLLGVEYSLKIAKGVITASRWLMRILD